MVDLERLRARGLQAYEIGRLRMALRILAVLSPGFLLCWLLGDRELCACLMPLLAGVAVWLRWRDRRGVDAVTLGLVAGAIPLAVGLSLSVFQASCGGPFCWAFASAAGAVGGLLVALRLRRHDSPAPSWFSPLAVAALAAVLGCSSLGALAITGVLAALFVGTGLGALVPAR